jgi:uncharacterized membrane protein HdeD (DUF308 family)
MFFKKKFTLSHLAKKLTHVIGIVLVWRGIWTVLDKLDERLFDGSHMWTGIFGTLVGLFMLY